VNLRNIYSRLSIHNVIYVTMLQNSHIQMYSKLYKKRVKLDAGDNLASEIEFVPIRIGCQVGLSMGRV